MFFDNADRYVDVGDGCVNDVEQCYCALLI